MSKYVIDSTTLVSIGDAVREKEGTTEPILVSDLATRISAIETGGGGGGDLPEEAFTITGDCSYRFAYDGWNWFIDNYGKKLKVKDISSTLFMFSECKQLKNIPLKLDSFKGTSTGESVDMSQMFKGCSYLESIPVITNVKVYKADSIFEYCYRLKELDEASVIGLDWSLVDNGTASYYGQRAKTFNGCYSLRKYPNSFLAHGNPLSNYSNSVYYYLFNNCQALDEIVDLPIIYRNTTWTSNTFNYSFDHNCRLKKLTFEVNEDGSPIVINTWSRQAIDLSQYVGWVQYEYMLTEYDGGFNSKTKAMDDATYQNVKDNPDWWTSLVDYSRYNHDSAVETINTLPDLSGGAGTNTITFKGAAGAKTDGGAINTLTEEEIAVATAKGWTVTLK